MLFFFAVGALRHAGNSPLPPVDVELLRDAEPVAPDAARGHGTLGKFFYGSPEEIARAMRDLAAGAPVETIYFWASLGGMPEDVVVRNVQTIATKLAPLLAAIA